MRSENIDCARAANDIDNFRIVITHSTHANPLSVTEQPSLAITPVSMNIFTAVVRVSYEFNRSAPAEYLCGPVGTTLEHRITYCTASSVRPSVRPPVGCNYMTHERMSQPAACRYSL